jgi:F-type H+-transporting ATPase subunit a
LEVPKPASEVIFHVFGLPVTNTIFSTWLIMIVLIVLAIIVSRRLRMVPGRMQAFTELILTTLLSMVESNAGRGGRRFFPLIATLFIFILGANWIGLFPGFGDITWLRSPNSDLNITAAMAFVIVFPTVQFTAFRTRGLGYLKSFLTMPIEIVSELSRPLTLALRLFGNVFAGEVLLSVIGKMLPVGLPLIFILLEFFFGAIQALVFSVLALIYLIIASSHHDKAGERQH